MPHSDSKAPASIEAHITRLCHVLAALCQGYERLHESGERKREAIRRADVATIMTVCAEERTMMQRVNELETVRHGIAQSIGETLHLKNPKAITITQIADALEDDASQRVRAVGDRLRDAVLAVQHQSSVIQKAAQSLGAHMTGLMQTIGAAIGRAGTYSPQGRLAGAAAVHCSVDLKS